MHNFKQKVTTAKNLLITLLLYLTFYVKIFKKLKNKHFQIIKKLKNLKINQLTFRFAAAIFFSRSKSGIFNY